MDALYKYIKIGLRYPELDVRIYPNRSVILGYLYEKEEDSITNIHKGIGVSYPNTFGNLKSLEKIGYVKRKKEGLKNKTLYSLTPKGKKIIGEIL